jgi:hypothetical protein
VHSNANVDINFNPSKITSNQSALSSEEDGGWVWAGGGEHIVNQHNPWFMGPTPVKYCIDHGGDELFSLSKERSKITVANAINNLTDQLKSINKHDGYYLGNTINVSNVLKCGVFVSDSRSFINWGRSCKAATEDAAPNTMYMSDRFIYTNNCENADLEIILGNINNPKIQKLKNNIGTTNFQRIAGVSIRTHYSEDSLRGKGFIYIAADKGSLQYSGDRSKKIMSDNIWNIKQQIPEQALFPDNIEGLTEVTSNATYLGFKLQRYVVGPLEPIMVHELGHIFGFVHNTHHNIMNEDYPAKIVREGFTFYGNYQTESGIFERGLIETNRNTRVSFDWNKENIEPIEKSMLFEASPSIFKFLFNTEDEYGNYGQPDVFFIFEIGDKTMFHTPSYLKIAEFSKYKLTYDVKRTLKLKNFESCQGDKKVESINIRYSKTIKNSITRVYNSQTRTWDKKKTKQYKVADTNELLRFSNRQFCGTLQLGDRSNNYLNVKLVHNYYMKSSTLDITDPRTGHTQRLYLKQGALLSDTFEDFNWYEPSFEFID